MAELQNTVKQYNTLNVKFRALPPLIMAPLDKLRNKLKSKGILSKSNKPKAIGRLMTQPDEIIISWFNSIGQNLLKYYHCCDNFYKVQTYVDYFIRWSAIHTLAGKHRISCKRVVVKWSKNLIIQDYGGFKLVSFPNSYSIRSLDYKFLTDVNGNKSSRVLNQL
jgi:hypothetical protein